MPKTQSKLSNILVLLVSSFICLVVVEFYLQYFTVFPIHGQSNLQPHNFLGHSLSPDLPDVDDAGFRNKSGVSATILGIGDSHTYGHGVDPEDSWPAKLSSRIKKPVYNFGVGGYNVLHYGVILARFIPADTTDIILALYMANDFSFGGSYEYCAANRGRAAIVSQFGIELPRCDIRKPRKNMWQTLKEKVAIVSVTSYVSQRYLSGFISKKMKSNKIEKKDGTITIDGVPMNLEHVDRYNSSTDLTNKMIAERVDFFLTLLKKFKELNPTINLKILLIPSKELILTSAEEKCPRTEPSGISLNEISLKSYLKEQLEKNGFQVEDAFHSTLEKYCNGSNRSRDNFYPDFDSHPRAAGYEAYAEAAYRLYSGS